MKLLAWVFILGLVVCSTPIDSKPLYRAGEGVSASRSLLHGEISAGYVFSSHQLESVAQQDNSSRLRGLEARALWSPLPWLSIGAEFDKLGDEKLAPMIQSYGVTRWAGIIKLTLSPNTNPRFYVMGGYGKSKHKLQYDHSNPGVRFAPTVTKSWTYWLAGVGMEVDVWKSLFVGIEGNYVRYNDDTLTEFFKLSSRTETSLHARLGLRF